MLRFISIRSRFVYLSALLVLALIVTNTVLINQTRRQNDLIARQVGSLDQIAQVGFEFFASGGDVAGGQRRGQGLGGV